MNNNISSQYVNERQNPQINKHDVTFLNVFVNLYAVQNDPHCPGL